MIFWPEFDSPAPLPPKKKKSYGKDISPKILQGGSALSQSDWIIVFLHGVFGVWIPVLLENNKGVI